MPIRAVADTNVVVSGLLWRGPPRRVLDAARDGRVTLSTCSDLLAELDDVLRRPSIARRLTMAAVTPQELVLGYAALALPVLLPSELPSFPRDPDDAVVLAAGISAQAEYIVTGDHLLLDLKTYQGIQIVSAVDFLARLPA